MGFSSTTPPIWPVTPDWTNGIEETLSWVTGILQAEATGLTKHSGLRLGPRRSFSFRLVHAAQEKRIAAMLIAGHSDSWLLPIWPDVFCLPAPVSAGDQQIGCATLGRDFVAGGKALVYQNVTTWQVVDVAAVHSDRIELASPAASAPAGARLYPLRLARLTGGADENHLSEDVSTRTMTFEIDEACEWPDLEPAATYRGHPVLTERPDESADPSSTVERLLNGVDYGTARPLVYDLPRVALRTQQSHWKLWGRAEHTWFRSLLYALDGRRIPAWVPSWSADLLPVGTVAANNSVLEVEWAGYSLYGQGRSNRNHIRIELQDGEVLYREIKSAISGGNVEYLTLDLPLASNSLPAAAFRLISFMALCVQASDDVEIQHATDADGEATVTIGWQEVVPNDN